MARRKNAPESVKVKQGLSERLRELRTEFYGERGGPDLARTLGIPVRTWYNYETGVTVPAEIMLRVVELTSVEPVWLLRGEGPKYRAKPAVAPPRSTAGNEGSSVSALLRAALDQLERKEREGPSLPIPSMAMARLSGEDGSLDGVGDDLKSVLFNPQRDATGELAPVDEQAEIAARGEWIDAGQAHRQLRVADDAMAPIVAEGAHVAYAEAEPVSEAFHDKLVVAWIDDKPVVRWFQHCGRYALLRAENPAASTSSLVDLDDPKVQAFHRVLWISTPH
jgi:hypothetical protein